MSKVKRKWAWDKIKLRSTMGQFLQASCEAAEEGAASSPVAQATGLLFVCENDFILGFYMTLPCYDVLICLHIFSVLPAACCVMFLDVSLSQN